jgi:hypothetical protein
MNTMETARAACCTGRSARPSLARITSGARLSNSAAADRPSQLLEPLPERRGATLSLRIVLRIQHQHAHAPHPVPLLRLGGARRGDSTGQRGRQEGRGGPSFNHLIRPQRRRDREAERLGGLEIDDQVDLRGLLYRNLPRVSTFEDLVDMDPSAPILSASFGEYPISPLRREKPLLRTSPADGTVPPTPLFAYGS